MVGPYSAENSPRDNAGPGVDPPVPIWLQPFAAYAAAHPSQSGVGSSQSASSSEEGRVSVQPSPPSM